MWIQDDQSDTQNITAEYLMQPQCSSGPGPQVHRVLPGHQLELISGKMMSISMKISKRGRLKRGAKLAPFVSDKIGNIKKLRPLL